jgi:hypothetical protein
MKKKDLWKDSVCAACGKAECFGTCPQYEELEIRLRKWYNDQKILDKEPDYADFDWGDWPQ